MAQERWQYDGHGTKPKHGRDMQQLGLRRTRRNAHRRMIALARQYEPPRARASR